MVHSPCYGTGAFIALLVKRVAIPWVIAGILVVYSIILLAGNGFEFADNNVVSIVAQHCAETVHEQWIDTENLEKAAPASVSADIYYPNQQPKETGGEAAGGEDSNSPTIT